MSIPGAGSRCVKQSKGKMVGGMAGVGPAWTYNKKVEAPKGEKDMGSWKAAVSERLALRRRRALPLSVPPTPPHASATVAVEGCAQLLSREPLRRMLWLSGRGS